MSYTGGEVDEIVNDCAHQVQEGRDLLQLYELALVMVADPCSSESWQVGTTLFALRARDPANALWQGTPR